MMKLDRRIYRHAADWHALGHTSGAYQVVNLSGCRKSATLATRAPLGGRRNLGSAQLGDEGRDEIVVSDPLARPAPHDQREDAEVLLRIRLIRAGLRA